MKKIELSDDFFSGMDRKKASSVPAGSARREIQAVRTILGTRPLSPVAAQSRPSEPVHPRGPGALLSLPFAMAGHMMALCASLVRITLPPFGRR
jgi:hypothetical protein